MVVVEEEETNGTSPNGGHESNGHDVEKNGVETNEAEASIETGVPLRDELQTTVSWFRSLQVVLRKNFLLLRRRPITIMLMIFSSIFSVLLAWAVGKDSEQDFGQVPLTDCGTVSSTYYQNLTYEEQYAVPLSYNDNWRSGLAVTLLSLGPLVNAICSFLLVHEEIANQMLGVLRGLGLRESVFWMSWWVPFLLIALVNSILGAIAAQFIDVHVYQNTYFGGVFASLFFLQLALMACSLFCAALCCTSRKGAPWIILVMLVALWVPLIVLSAQSVSASAGSAASGLWQTPAGLFWVNSNTTWTTYSSDAEDCDKPLISEEQGKFYKTPEEREEYLSSPEDFFIGCYFSGGYNNYLWNPSGGKFGAVVSFLFPYTHFLTMWSNYLGYTGMANRKFTAKEASMSSEELAIRSLQVPPDEANAKGTSLYPQGSTFILFSFYVYDTYIDEEGIVRPKNNCPAQDASESFCPNINNCVSAVNPAPTQSPSTNQMIGFLVALMAFYTLLAAYWAQVFPGANGAPRKFYFFLLPSYWFGSCAKKSADLESESSSRAGVVVENVHKQYGDFEALKSVSMNMECGEVTALLGHNGAGKTTLSRILSCEIPSTSGDVSVFGHSVTKDPSAVRRLVGMCRQDDFLYPDLSAKEHLELFAGLRGVPKEEIPSIVQKWLESVDLAVVQDQFSASFSGGMKRRLSVACSTIGSRPLIILDEPTTGMDPVSRRFVWKHIEEVKDGRVVLLTTHAMEEADLLCDTVAVMRKGELAAFGTPLQLKSEYGSALQFALLVDRDDTTATKETILERFANSVQWVEVDAGDAGNITVKIHQIRQDKNDDGIDVDELADFVAWLESDDSGVSEYGFSNSSLEEVFLKVTSETDDEEEKTDDDVEVCGACCCNCCISCCLRGPCRCCCCPKPHIHENEEPLETNGDIAENGLGVEAAETGQNEIASFAPVLTARRQAEALFRFSFTRNWTGKGSIANWVIYSLFIVGLIITGVMATGGNDPVPVVTMAVIFLSLLLLSIISPIYLDRQLQLFYLMRTQGLLRRGYILGTSMYAFAVTLLYGLVALSIFYATPLFREPTLCPINSNSGSYCYDYKVLIDWWEDEFNGESVELYAVAVPGNYGRIIGAAVFFALTMPGGVLSSSYVPGYKFALVFVVFVALFASFLPLGFYLAQGSQSAEEWDECGWNICNTTLSSLTIDTVGSISEDFLDCIGLDVQQSSSLAALCIKPVASILPQFGLFQSLAMTLISDIKFVSDPPEYVDEVLIPAMNDVKCSGDTCVFPYARWYYGATLGFMALGAFILLILGVVLVSFFSFPDGFVLKIRNQVSRCFGRLQCIKSKHGKRDEQAVAGAEDKEMPLEEVVEEQNCVKSIVKPLLTPAEKEPEVMEEGGEELGVEIVIDHGSIPRDDLPPVLTYELRKVYPSLNGLPPKVALDSLDLHVPKGQVLGLLGKNGAGKTTALKILSVSHKASGGLALVAGYDVSCEQISVFERLGNCPQFDIIWPGLTVQRHLEFFANLKGLPRKKVKEIALSIATAVGLGYPAVYSRRAGALSGGMRRRLSIAISLIGAPKVLLLDEPSTGLDPSTRNSIWGLVNSFATEDRAIIITTHMMIEADTLCNRIAILAKGQLKVIATQQHLKDRFGSGYLLQLNLMKSTPENQECAMQFVRNRLNKDAVLQTKQAKTLHISLPRDSDLTKIFRALYSPESSTEGGINQFLLSQSSLEDVFIALGE